MAVEVEYEGYIELMGASEVPEQIVEEWANTLSNEATRIFGNLYDKLNTLENFKKFLATPAIEGYADYVNPNHPKANVAKLKHAVKLIAGYDKFISKIEALKDDPTSFQAAVTSDVSKNAYRNVRFALSGVGHKATLGYGALIKGVMCITGDNRVKGYLSDTELKQGDVYNVFKPSLVQFVKPMMIAIGTFGVANAFYATVAEDPDLQALRDTILNEVNSNYDEILNAFKRDDVTFANLDFSLTYDDLNDRIVVYAIAETA